jgi:hypothetical protein
MAYTTTDDPSAYFQTALYTGNGSTQSITNDGNSDLQPDWVWIKERNNAVDHQLQDSTRGVTKTLQSNSNNGESTLTDIITSFNSDGFSLGNNVTWNGSSDTYVAWQWKANGGTTSSNSDGSITSTVQANTTAGFSIVTWSGNTTAGATVGHGLGVAPHYVQVKRRDRDGDAWRGFWQPLGDEKYLELNANDAEQDSTTGAWNDTSPTSSVFSLGSAAGINGGNMVAYCFAPIQGYSKIGSYTGNGNADGAFVYTGFKPAWIMIKQTDGTGSWAIHDTKRGTINPIDEDLFANLNSAESDNDIEKDILSNGFKLRASHSAVNGNGNSYIYMAFAESPFVSSKGVPTTAR